MGPTALTPKQKRILDFIETFSQKQGYAPSQHEIAKHFGFTSLGTVQNYLVRLERHGLLKKSWNGKRALEIQKDPDLSPHTPQPFLALQNLPLVGRVAAGRPIEAIETAETLDVPTSLLKNANKKGDHFVLKVTGDSMIEDGILEGDFVIIQKQLKARNGQTVVATIRNEATIKRFFQMGERIELKPANAAYEPIILESLTESDQFRIEGVLVGVIRKVD